jgi:two-component system CheB/CheR fusion protein
MSALAGERNTDIEILSAEGRWLSLRILPYRGQENAIDGAIAMLIDIDDLRRGRDFAEIVAGIVHEPMLVLDAGLQVRAANEAFYRRYRIERGSTEGRLIYEVGQGQWNIPKLKQLLEEILPRKTAIKEFEIRQSDSLGSRILRINAREIRQKDGERMILMAIIDAAEPHVTATVLV